jgi:hypothetical protein
MIKNSSKSGFALSVLLVGLLVLSLAIVVLIPVFSGKNDLYANTSQYVKICIVDDNAQFGQSSKACENTTLGLKNNSSKDYDTLIYYVNEYNTIYTQQALSIAKAGCGAGSHDACNILLDRCAANGSTYCTPLQEYTTISPSCSDYANTRGAEYYLEKMTNFNDAIDATCTAHAGSMACGIKNNSCT